MPTTQTNEPLTPPASPPGGSRSSIRLTLGVVLGSISIGSLLYYFMTRPRKVGERSLNDPWVKSGYQSPTSPSGMETYTSITQNESDASQTIQAITQPIKPDGPAKLAISAATRPEPLAERQVQKYARPKGSGISSFIILIVCAGLLFFTQLVTNLSDWFKIDLSFLQPLQAINCAVPSLCELRFPAYGFIGLLAALLAAGVFGWRIKSMGLPVLTFDLPTVAPAAVQIKRLSRWPLSLVGIVFLCCEGVVITQAVLGQSVQPIVWLVSLVAAWWLIWQATRQVGAVGKSDFLWNAAYLIGIFTLLLTTAALATQRWGLGVFTGFITVVFLGGIFYTHWRKWDLADKVIRLALPALTLISFLMFSYGIDSWAWSFLGDEYAFFDLAREFARGNVFADLLSGAGVYGYHPILSSAWQGTTMWLFGADAYGWRVSHSLLLAGSIPLFYYFMRAIIGRSGALAAAALYGSAHVLLSLGRVGSNNAQIIIIMVLSWAAFLWSARRGSLAGFALTGIFIGLGFYTYAVARVYSLLMAVWLMLYYFPINWRQRRINWTNIFVWGCVVGLAVLTALPVLSTRSAWEGQLHQTIFTSEVAFTPYDIFSQFITNTFYSFSSFLYNNQNAVFVYGAHADPITSSLMILGLSAIIVTWKYGWKLRFGLLCTYAIYTVIVGGLQPYNYPSITRLFTLAPFYALFGAIGLVAVGQILARWLQARPAVQWILGSAMLMLVGSVMFLNNWLSVSLSQRYVAQQLPAFWLQTAQLTGDSQGVGPHIYIVSPPDEKFWIDTLYGAYNIPLDRYTLIYPRDALQDTQLCEAGQHAAVLMIPASVTESGYLANQIHDCWNNSQIRLIKNGQDNGIIYRVLSAEALASVHPIPGYWAEEEPPQAELAAAPANDLWQAFQPRGLAVDANGKVAVVEAATESLLFFDSTGQIVGVLKGIFVYPSDVAFLPNGDLVVADAGVGVLVFDNHNKLRYQIGGVSSPRGLGTTAQGDIYVAEAARGQVSVYNAQGELLRAYVAEGRFGQPTSVAVSAAGLIAVGDPILGKVFVLDQDDHIRGEFTINTGDSSDSKPGVLWLPDGSLLYTDPTDGVMWQVNQDGTVLNKWTDLQRPNDLALAPDGVVYLLESAANRVVPMSIH